MHFPILNVLSLSTLVSALDPHALQGPKSIEHALKKAEIIPTVLKDFRPLCVLDIVFNASHHSVHYGNRFPVANVTSPPLVQIQCPYDEAADVASGPDEGFVLALTDPDAPSRKSPKWSEMAHWLVAFNASGYQNELLAYKPPGPPKGTGKHRYVFVLMSGNITDIRAPEEREHWGYGKGKGKKHRKTKGVQKWSRENGLRVVGANYLVAEHS